jgi:tRNA A37 threonylcarbamoyladenosine synthetase subunit TsaC/SUA5/YrdC
MAVSSANKSGSPPALTAAEAQQQLGDEVAVYLDGGPARSGIASTIVDVTTELPRVLRRGAVEIDALREVVPDLVSTAA